ncbi:hypothetical protein R1sor_012763 [Riccia sorocarpa]|uniref:Uncharacterized protein n=1 Tax=Riccia sorocarpa TaxID=122646 RepID=A0ABD3I4P6_9MARC
MAVFEQVVAMVIDGGIPRVRMAVLMQHLIEKVDEQDFSLVPNAERDAREEVAALLLQQQLFEEKEDIEIEKIVESLRKAQARAEAKNPGTP